MEQFINEVIEKLSHRFQDQELIMIRSALFYVGKDYDIKPLSTEIAVVTDELPKEVKEYLVTKKIEGRTDSTLSQYLKALKRFTQRVRKPMSMITTMDLRAYLYELKEQTQMADVSLENERIYISSFFKWLAINGYITKDPSANLTPIKCEKKIREPLIDSELETLRAVCKTPKEKALIETLYSTGCRVSEIVNIKIRDIDFEQREVKVFGKGKKQRIVYLNAKALLSIKMMLGARKYDSVYLFENDRQPHGQLKIDAIRKTVKTLGKRAEISGRVFPHRIRHTTATDALRRGMSIEQVQQLLGHEEIATTLEYAKVNREEVKEKHTKYIV